jgi:apolipoprotein D and lipocalin family protein
VTRPLKLLLLFAAAWLAMAGAAAQPAPLQSVGSVDLQRYVGRWYEIAHYPNRFQRQCVGDTTANYAAREDGTIAVTNRCATASGASEAEGVARRVDGRTDRLQVSFLPAALRWLPIGWGDYWVIALAPDYRYAVVGEPSREFLWVLARAPTLSAEDRAAIDTALRAQGYDPARLVQTPQGAR